MSFGFHTTWMLRMLFCLPFLAGQPASAQTAPEQPNFIFILVDDLNDYLSVLEGHPQLRTPNIDRLASRGTLFTNAYCSSPLCAPSRTSLLTGKHPTSTDILNNNDHAGVPQFRDLFDPADGPLYTLPEILKDSGDYYTYSLIKTFHGQYYPGGGNLDFDYDTSTADPCSRGKSWSFLQDWEDICDPNTLYPSDCDFHSPDSDDFNYSYGYKLPAEGSKDQRAADSTIAFLNRYASNPAAFCDKPFFLNLGFVRPHSPWFVQEEYFSEWYNSELISDPLSPMYNDPPGLWPANGYAMAAQPAVRWADTAGIPPKALNQYGGRLGRIFRGFADTISSLPSMPGATDSLIKQVLEENFRAQSSMAYEAGIRLIDDLLGQLMDELDSHPELAANTLIVFTSDHGFNLGEKQVWGKSNLWETGIRVPMIVYDPRQPGSRTSTRTVSLLDLFPTFVELAGIKPVLKPDGTAYAEGKSFAPLLDDPTAAWDRPVLISFRKSGPVDHSVRDERFHYIRYNTGSGYQEELYEIGANRDVDPEEWNNLALDPAYAGIKSHLAQYLPGGSRYLSSETWGADIIPQENPCSYDLGDTLRLGVLYRDAFGASTSLPSNLTAEWIIRPGGDTINSTELELALADVDTSLFSAGLPMRVELRLLDTLTGQSSSDLISIPLAWQLPAVDFELSLQDGPQLRVTDLQRSGTAPTGVLWEFSNGQTFLDTVPPPVQWTEVGNAWIRQTAYFNPLDSTCRQTTIRSVHVDSSYLLGAPCSTPQPAIIQNLDYDQVQVELPKVFGASQYLAELYLEGQESPIKSSPAYTGASRRVGGLQSDQSYYIRFRALCDAGLSSSDSSDWSSPSYFRTPACQAPRGLRISPLSSTEAALSWTPSGQIDAQELTLFLEDSLLARRILTADRDDFSLDGLEASTEYRVEMRSHCMRQDASTFKSNEWTRRNFQTLDSLSFRMLRSTDMKVYPNPGAGHFRLSCKADEGSAILRVQDSYGRQLREIEMETQEGTWQFRLDLENLPSGLYNLTFSQQNQHCSEQVVLIRD